MGGGGGGGACQALPVFILNSLAPSMELVHICVFRNVLFPSVFTNTITDIKH